MFDKKRIAILDENLNGLKEIGLFGSIAKDEFNRYIPSFNLIEEELANLTDYYFDAKCPGNDFFNANEEDFNKCYKSNLKKGYVDYNVRYLESVWNLITPNRVS